MEQIQQQQQAQQQLQQPPPATAAVEELPAATTEASKATEATKPKAKTATMAEVNVGDDLTQLSGVGPALLKKLNAAGISSFGQIATWTDADVVEIDEKLSFKGRVVREGWVEQAKNLATKS